MPEHWEVRRLKSAMQRIVGGATPSTAEETFWNGDVVWVTPADVSRRNALKASLRTISRAGLDACSSELVPRGSIIVTCRAPVGNAAIAEVELCTNQGCKALVLNPQVMDSRFALNLLTILKGEIQSRAKGTTFTEIASDDLGAVPIPLPPPEEQAAIVRFLDYADRRIRRYVRAKRRLIALLEEQKQAIIHRAVTRGLDPDVRLKPSGVEWLGDIPEHWEVRRLGRLSRVFNGSTPSKLQAKYWEGGTIPWLSSSRVNDGVVTQPTDFVTTLALRECSISLVPRGALIVGLIGQGRTRGMAALLGIDACISQNIAAVVPRAELNAGYLKFFLTAHYSQIREFGRGGNQEALNCEIVGRFPITLPPTSEQAAIVRSIGAEMARLDETVVRARAEIDLLLEFRTRVVADVVAGKLDVREAAARLPEETDEAEPLDDLDLPDDDLGDLDADEAEAELAEAVT